VGQMLRRGIFVKSIEKVDVVFHDITKLVEKYQLEIGD
jgi:CRISPR/Cas system-associated endonuclease Cas3-HD